MCLQETELVRSHLIPASIYDYCRTANASPVRVGDGVVMPTDRQTQAYLLCTPCEGILNRGGETWTNTKLATVEQTFPLHDLLMNAHAAFEDANGGIYFAAGNPEFDFQSLTHFAMGIFWKASVHSWKGGEKDPRIELGPYEIRSALGCAVRLDFRRTFALRLLFRVQTERWSPSTNPSRPRTSNGTASCCKFRVFYLY